MQKASESLNEFIGYLAVEHGCTYRPINVPVGGTAMVMENSDFRIVLTICENHIGKWVLKVEDIRVNPELRGHGVGTFLIDNLKILSDSKNVPIGLWVKEDRLDLVGFYHRRGFKIQFRNRDFWMEYKPI